MIEIQLPNGQIAQFPEGTADSTIESVLAKEFPIEQQEVGYLEQISKGSPQRQQEMNRISSQFGQGEISAPEYVFQNLGEAAGNIGDVVGRGMGDIGSAAYGLLPEQAQQKIGSTLAPIGQAIAPYIQAGQQGYGAVKERFPRAMENVEAGTNIGTMGVVGGLRRAGIQESVGTAGKAIKQKLMPNPKTLSAQELKEIGGGLFQVADQKGGILQPQFTNKYLDDIAKELPQTEAGIILQGENNVTQLIRRAQELRDKPLNLESAKEIDEILGELAYSNLTPFGELDKNGRKFANMQATFRESIENADEAMVSGGKEGFEALKDARNYWSTSLRLRDVERIIEKGLQAEQPATSIKNGFKTLLNSKKIKNYSPQEVQAIREAANKGVMTDLVGTFGSRLSPQITGAAVFVGSGANPFAAAGAAAANYAVSAGARKAATNMQLKKANFVENLIRERVGEGNQKFKLTPEIKKLAKEAGVMSFGAGGVDVIMNELQQIQETGTVQEEQ